MKHDFAEALIIGAEDKLGMLRTVSAQAAAVAPAPQVSTGAPASGSGLGQVSAALSRAGRIGSISVPASWANAPSGPSGALFRAALPSFGGSAEPAATELGVPGGPGGKVSRPSIVVPRYGRRLRVMWPSPAVG